MLGNNQYKRLGYEIVGWDTKETTNVPTYGWMQSVSMLGDVDEVVNLYPVWDYKKYEIQYRQGDITKPYLIALRDSENESDFPDLTIEANADKWIRESPASYCNTNDKSILTQVLNDYDQETKDFRDWEVSYTQEELSEIIRTKSGIDFGEIIDLIPLKRGKSGRIYELKIVGTKHTEIIGKELKIRQWLSKTCLYSSWFEVKKTFNSQLSTFNFQLIGHGWGHGAGLCQIGAAVMASEGKSYEEILSYYYHNTQLKIKD